MFFPLYCFIFASWFKLFVVHISQNLLSYVDKLDIDVCELIFFLFAKYAISLCDYFWFEGRILVIVSSAVYFSFEYFAETDLFAPSVHDYKFLTNIVYVFPIVAVVFIKWNELILAIWWCITVWVTFLALGKCLVLLHARNQ